jgi:hypothetical protein
MFGITEKPVAIAAPTIQPAAWLVLDIETGDAPESAIQAALATWMPPANVKDPAKIEARRVEAREKIQGQAALLDASPVLCVAVQTEQESVVFNGIDTTDYHIDGWTVIPGGDEHGMLIALREWANGRTTESTLIVGHNHRAFDLPKLRSAYVRHQLHLPQFLTPKLNDEAQPRRVDTMTLYKAFSMEHRDDRYIDLDTVAAGLGIPRPKAIVSGRDVPKLHREGHYHAVLTYCCVDTVTTTRAFQLMSSTAPDLA